MHNFSYKQYCTFQGDKNKKFPTIGLMVKKKIKKFKVSRLNVDKQLFKEAKINLHKLIKNKKSLLPGKNKGKCW